MNQLDEVLRQRALDLARPKQEKAPQQAMTALFFARGKEKFAIQASDVKEVRSHKAGLFCRLPGQTGCLVGISNIRGKLLAVADLALVFGHEVDQDGQWIIVLEVKGPFSNEKIRVGVLSDELPRFLKIPLSQIGSTEHMPHLSGQGFVNGIIGGGRLLLDVKVLVKDGHLVPKREETV